MIDPAAQIACVARSIGHCEVSDTELGGNRENLKHFRDSED
jgi:hypothetical protein